MRQSPTERRTGHRSTFAVLALGVAAFAFLQSLVNPVLPTVQAELGSSQTDVTWVLTANFIAASVFTPILGRLGDMTGKKRMFVVGLGTMALGCLLSAVATDLSVMIIGRVVQGVGGGVLPLAFGIIRDEFPQREVPGAVGAIAGLTALGGGVGLILAGPIVDAFGYHWLFWVPLIVTVLSALAAQFLLPESRALSAGSINWISAALLSGWLVGLLLAVSQAPTWGWSSPSVLALLAAAVVLAVVWVVAESRAEHPLIDMTMMRIRAVWATNLVTLALGAAVYSALGFLPQLLQASPSDGHGLGASVTESGLMMLPQTVAVFVLGLVAGRMALRFGSRNLVVVGSLVSAVGFLLVVVAHDSEWAIYLITAVNGAGFGLAFSAVANLIVAAVPAHQTGVASGINANVRTIGGAVGAALMASIVSGAATTGGPPGGSGYATGFLVLTGVLVLSALAALLIPEVRRDSRIHNGPDVEMRHPEVALVPGGTLVESESGSPPGGRQNEP
ncbi:drug resistance transporter, EmrB/QacA subfamily [Geodermatophilus amargosae]|uniref:Drug resistance transporter, EmrB/QacA subfamily n=1 Tax=Geodermatophilus amargosae TaxID=1296565 RepID=A0A1I7B599_9ACTN|nr:MFS transporter [Geodermatophilus amargosae]SFT82305.1 drug resistance transporter, EmrB/QacA subfamily [Geodermatophilus amargosae]